MCDATPDLTSSLARIARVGKANQIAAALEESTRGEGRHFCHFCPIRLLRAAEELRQSQPKCIRLVELKEISAAAAADCFSTPPIHSADLYDTLVHFNFTLPLLFHLPVRLLPASKKRTYAIASRKGERERVNSLQKRARDGEMERERGSGEDGREGVQFQHKM